MMVLLPSINGNEGCKTVFLLRVIVMVIDKQKRCFYENGDLLLEALLVLNYRSGDTTR